MIKTGYRLKAVEKGSTAFGRIQENTPHRLKRLGYFSFKANRFFSTAFLCIFRPFQTAFFGVYLPRLNTKSG
jgi:hypothetical protein